MNWLRGEFIYELQGLTKPYRFVGFSAMAISKVPLL